jgi:hypothetical protein
VDRDAKSSTPGRVPAAGNIYAAKVVSTRRNSSSLSLHLEVLIEAPRQALGVLFDCRRQGQTRDVYQAHNCQRATNPVARVTPRCA